MVAQAVHCGGVPSIAKLPVPAPMFAGFEKVIEVDVKLSFPLSDNTLPGAIGAACADVPSPMNPTTTAPAKRRAFM